MDNDRAVATVGALKVVESMGMADLVDNPDVFTTLEKSTTGMVERVSISTSPVLTVMFADNARLIPLPEKRPRANSCPLMTRSCPGRFGWWSSGIGTDSGFSGFVFDFFCSDSNSMSHYGHTRFFAYPTHCISGTSLTVEQLRCEVRPVDTRSVVYLSTYRSS